MSRNEKWLRDVCAKNGLTPTLLQWTPPHGPYEMEGYCGGWEICFAETLDMAGGLSTVEAIKDVEGVAERLRLVNVAREVA